MKSIFGRSARCMVVLAGMLLACTPSLYAKPLLGPGDRMVFLGDSITEQRIYTRYVMDFFAMRYPGAKISFRNAGWSGDTAPGGLNRLERDVLSQKPTVVSICFGMNDGGYKPFDKAAYEKYMTGMTGLVTSLKKAGVNVVLLTPGCVDPDGKGWVSAENLRAYNGTLALLAKGVRELADREHLAVFDLHALMMDVQTRAKADDPSFTMIPDSVHPSPPGQLVMAYALLKALNCDEQASGLEIDVKTARAIPDRCKVTNLRISENAVNFARTDDALPAFLDPEAQATLKYCSVVSELDQYPLKVTGLRAGKWKLTVQGTEVGTFTADELAAGINPHYAGSMAGARQTR